MISKNRTAFLLLVSCVIFFDSCINTQNLTYFNNLPDSAKVTLNKINLPMQTIQVNDLLEVKVGGENEKTVEYINQYLGAGTSANGIERIVDIDGNIELPKIGKVHVGGASRDSAQKKIADAYAEYLQHPIVSVRYINFGFSVLGEVKVPGYYTVTNEKINIFEAVAKAGDMTQYALRDKVKIIRETNGQREVISLNFIDKNILNSPYYYLNRNDIIYIPPGETKANSENFTRTATLTATIVSVAAILITIFRK